VSRERAALIRWLWNHRQLSCAGLALLVYLIGLGRPPLWEPDEGRYAEIAREMIVSHDYITPRNNFVRYLEKPPLVHWLTAASLKLFGQNEFAVRLQATIASAGQVAITDALGEQMFDPATGVLAALALALSPLFFAFAHFATPDPALAFFLTAAMACFYKAARATASGCMPSKRNSTGDSHPVTSFVYWREIAKEGLLSAGVWRPTPEPAPSKTPARYQAGRIDANWILAAAAMLALGTLTKGLVALALGGAIAILWLILQGRIYDTLRIPWIPCGILYLGLTLPWFILVAQRNSGFLHFFIIHEHFQRYLESTEHSWGPWFYVPITITGTWPWFYFVPFALTGGVVRSSLPFVSRTIAQPAPSLDFGGESVKAAVQFLLSWFAVVLVFFSIPRSKLGQYILPGLPPIAILAGYGLMRIENLAAAQRRRLFMIFAGINAAAGLALMAAVIDMPSRQFGNLLTTDAVIVVAALVLGGIASVAVAGRTIRSVALLAVMSVMIEMVVGINARQRVAALVSYRKLASVITPYTTKGCRLFSYGHFEQGLPFYAGTRETLVNYRGELDPFGPPQDPSGEVFSTSSQLRKIWASDECAIVVVNSSDMPTVSNLLSPKPIVIGREGKKIALSNRPF
jgi:4-amino-4-deoxy-L-arabinose transferase-like glycosyltransferase